MSKKKHSHKNGSKPSAENVKKPAAEKKADKPAVKETDTAAEAVLQKTEAVTEKKEKKAAEPKPKNIKKAKKKKKLTLPKLLLGIVLLLVIPYAYLMLCGLVFDMWLKMYDMVLFIFYSLITFYIINIGIIIYLVIKYFRDRKK